ncbi:MAG: CBS domain-containing protein [Bdellovibrionota bacterium]
MGNQMKIESAMHPFPHSVGLDQTLRVALDLLASHGIRHLPVCEAGRVKGVLTDRDIEFALRVEKADPEDLKVRDCYTPDPYTVPGNTPVAEVSRRMAHEHIGCALIVEADRVVGIFTTVDACRVLAEVLSGRKEQ